MGRIDKVNNFFEQIEELSIKYKDYTPYLANSIPYRDPSTPEEISKAKKVANCMILSLGFSSIVFIATFVGSLFCTDKLLVKLLLLVVAIFLTGLTLKFMFGKLQVFTGIVVYKQSRGRRRKSEGVHYKISVIPENGEKVIYREIMISSREYRRVTEGTRVLVVNKGHKATIL